MAGRVIRVVPKTFITFSSGATAGSAAMTQYLARRVDISQWREVSLLVRLHTPTVILAMTVLPTIVVVADGFTEDDPSPAATTGGNPKFFQAPLTLTGTAVFGQQANTAIQMLLVGLPANAGGLIAIAITATQPATAVTCDLYVSIDLAGKE